MATPPPLYSVRFFVLLGLQFVFGLGFSSFFLLPKYLTEVHRADADTIGLVMAAGPIAAVAAIPFIATRIDQVARRWLMIGGALAMFTASVVFALGPNLGGSMYAIRALQGAGFTVYMAAGSVLVAELAPQRVGQAIGLLGAANLATNAIAPAIAEPIALSYGWRPVFVASAVCSLLAGFGAIALREGPVKRERRAAPPFPIAQPRFLRSAYSAVVLGVAFGTVVTFYQPLALELGMREVRDLFVGYTIAALSVRILLGGLIDRWPRAPVATASAALYAVVVLGVAGLRPGWLLPLGLGLGLAHGTLWPVLSAVVIEGVNPEVRGATMTWFSGCFHLGMVLSTLGFGFIAELTGYRAVLVMAAGLAASSVFVLARLGKVESVLTHELPEPCSTR